MTSSVQFGPTCSSGDRAVPVAKEGAPVTEVDVLDVAENVVVAIVVVVEAEVDAVVVGAGTGAGSGLEAEMSATSILCSMTAVGNETDGLLVVVVVVAMTVDTVVGGREVVVVVEEFQPGYQYRCVSVEGYEFDPGHKLELNIL